MNGLRRINLEQAINVRDLGGYPTPDGCTPYGRFIRADNMVGLTEADLETLYQAGVRTVIDLRTPGERERQPGSFENWRDVRVVPCSLLGESLDSFTGFMRSLGENYSEMIVRDRDHYRDLFEIILSENQRGGILFHCTAGKDRTGVTAALLLGLAACGSVGETVWPGARTPTLSPTMPSPTSICAPRSSCSCSTIPTPTRLCSGLPWRAWTASLPLCGRSSALPGAI